MSSDNGIYILQTAKGEGLEYRVECLTAIDNYKWDDDGDCYSEDTQVHIKNAREMWSGCAVLKTEEEAMEAAQVVSDRLGYTEYGVQFIHIDAEF